MAERDRSVPVTAGAHCFERACKPFESDTLLRSVSLHASIHRSLRLRVPGLHLLPAGILPPNPPELLGGDALRDVLDPRTIRGR